MGTTPFGSATSSCHKTSHAPFLPVRARFISFAALKFRTLSAFKVASFSRSDLELLAGLAASGRIRPVMDRRFALEDAAEALRVQGEFHARGKSLVIP